MQPVQHQMMQGNPDDEDTVFNVCAGTVVRRSRLRWQYSPGADRFAWSADRAGWACDGATGLRCDEEEIDKQEEGGERADDPYGDCAADTAQRSCQNN